jgi:hypothetical protein
MKIAAVIFIAYLSFSEIYAQDQIKQGTYSLGGSIGYMSETYHFSSLLTEDINVFNFGPSGSYFIVDHLELSFGLGYNHSSVTYEPGGGSALQKASSFSFEFGPRYYFPYGKLAPFIGAVGSLGWTSFNGQSYSTPTTSYSFIGGLEIFISEAAALEPAIKYEHIRMTDQNYTNLFEISIGVKYFIFQ